MNAAQMDEVAQILHIAPGEKDSMGIRACQGQGGGGNDTKKDIFFYHAYFKINFL